MTRKLGSGRLRRTAERRREHGNTRRSGKEGPPARSRAEWIGLAVVSLPGLAALAALLFTWMQVDQANKELRISEQGQITNRFNAAVTNLGSDSLDVRMGGIYALERIMQDSVRDRATVVSVLTAYVRRHAPFPAKGEEEERSASQDGQPPTDIEAVMHVLAERPLGTGGMPVLELARTDLSGLTAGQGRSEFADAIFRQADLSRAELAHANLSGAILEGAILRRADLAHASLTGAAMTKAVLSGARLTAADLISASLGAAHLDGAELSGARLSQAVMKGTILRDANLSGAYLTSTGLQKADLSGADLRSAEMTYADLTDADLTGADLSDAELTGTNLTGADLSDADLTGANLTGATLVDARLTGAKLKGVRGMPPL
ncbi:pentapeptide repeat-containing protein [Streptomyces sp. NPDC001741]|uniref:pentapeptide repeat-containing protein n=1 Tax=unclassified Streptomyces TaxID=2593676 RepID=UPI00367C9F93